MKSIVAILVLLIGVQQGLTAHAGTNQTVELQVTGNGFEPSRADVKPGIPVALKITRKTDSTCATEIHIPSKNIKMDLPLNKPVTIDVGKLEKGEIRFGCGMNMVTGKIFVH